MKQFFTFILPILLIALHSCKPTAPSAERVLAEQGDPNSTEVLVIAHRGDWRGAPENSVQAFENAIKMGCDIVEVDVRRSADGGLVVMHDATLDRTTEGSGEVAALTAEHITSLRLRNGCRRVVENSFVPTFEQVLLLCKDRAVIHLDKGYELFREVYELAKKHDMVEQIMFKTSNNPERVKSDYGDLIKQIPYVPVINLGGSKTIEHIDGHIALGAVAIECVIPKVTDAVLEQLEHIRKAGVKICIGSMWPSACGGHDDDAAVEAPDDNWGWILEQGASQIMTDRPRELLEYLRNKGRHI